MGRSQMLPVLSREVVEGKQRVAILDQALDSLVVFDAPSFDEGGPHKGRSKPSFHPRRFSAVVMSGASQGRRRRE
jgi:hypothetical protein